MYKAPESFKKKTGQYQVKHFFSEFENAFTSWLSIQDFIEETFYCQREFYTMDKTVLL